MAKIYGEKVKSYEVVKRDDGWIDLLVYHQNKAIRKYLKRHINDPQYFLKRRDQYITNNITAKRWFAQVIDDYRPYFQRKRVNFVFSDLVP